MKLEYTPDYYEVFTASRIAARRIFGFWKRYLGLPYFIVVGLAIYPLTVITNALLQPVFGGQITEILTLCVGAAFALVAYFVFLRFNRHLAVKNWRENALEQPTLFAVESEGLRWQQGETFVQVAYTDIGRMFVGGKLVGFQAGTLLLYVPYRAFESAGQIELLVRTVFERMSEKSRQRSLWDAEIRSMVPSRSLS